MAYFSIEKNQDGRLIAKVLLVNFSQKIQSKKLWNYIAEIGDSIFMSCSKENEIYDIMNKSRNKIGEDLGIIDQNSFAFCWMDFPIFELIKKQKINFSHNPFSMPQNQMI